MAAFGGFSNIAKVPELRRRILFSLGILAIYRVGVFITIPGVDRSVMRQVVRDQAGAECRCSFQIARAIIVWVFVLR